MSKIKIVHYSKTVGFSGTDRTSQLFAKYLAQSDKYEPFIVYREGDAANNRLDIAKSWLGEDHVIGHMWRPGKKGKQPPYLPEHDNLHEVLTEIDPQIVHVHRSGYQEWPGFRYMFPKAKWVETNIFGYADNSPKDQFDLHIYISDFIRGTARKAGAPDGPVLYNPIEMPSFDMTAANKEICRRALLDCHNLPDDAILLGRVGRADNFDPISLRALKRVLQDFPNVYYLVVNPCENWRRVAREQDVEKNVRFLNPIIDDSELSAYYMGLDVYAHARSDGECCPCNIQEAMMHGLPIVSHESHSFNGQSEIIGNGGFCVPIGDWNSYAECVLGLCANEPIADEDEVVAPIRQVFGRMARRRAMGNFEASCITGLLAGMYDWVLENK
jgi:glycosyltransferase involved in cell wall biosynthesis